MPKKLTLLLISQTQLARADVVTGKRSRVKEAWSRERLAGESTATLVDAAIRLGPKKTGDVWVLSTNVWTGVVHLASDVTAALDGEELEQAIGLEAETFSGISAFESRLGIMSLPRDETGESRWWVTQIPQSEWHEVDQTVKQAGGRLAGIGHAALAAFPESLSASSASTEQRWRLHQSFGETTISLQGSGTEIREVIALGDLKTQRNQNQFHNWCEETAASGESLAWITDQPTLEQVDCSSATILSLSKVAASRNHTDPTVANSDAVTASQGDLAGDQALRVWAETMASTLRVDRDGEVPGMPVAVAHKTPMSNQMAILMACGLGLLMGLACFGLYTLGSTKIADLDAQIESINDERKKLSARKRSLQEVEKSVTERRRKLDDLRGYNQLLSVNLGQALLIRQFQQTRWLQLVTALAESCEGDCWVRGLQTHGRQVKVQGMAISNRDIAVFASNLERIASPHGWRVHPAKTERNEMSLIEFEVSLDISDRVPGPAVVGAKWLNSELSGLASHSNPAASSTTPSTTKTESQPR